MSGEDAPRPYLEDLIVLEIKTNKQTREQRHRAVFTTRVEVIGVQCFDLKPRQELEINNVRACRSNVGMGSFNSFQMLHTRISQIQKRFHKSRNAERKTVTNPETLPQIQKRWGVVGTNPETNHKSRNVGRVSATNPETQTQKVLFCSWPPDLLTSPKSHAGIPKTSHTLGGPIREKGSLRGIRIRLGGPEVERFLVL